jgi:tRNA(fMet)-specific endonuclease VapC
MSHLLDANAVIDMLSNPRSAVLQRVAESDSGTVFVSAIAFAEVALGSASGKQPDTGVLDAMLEEIELLPFDEAAAREYSRLPFKRASFDRLIAAHAIATGLILVTANGADFAGIPGLTVEDWSRAD